ncbi:thiamine pyrophosphokinase [Aspergillus californicus]
MEWDPTQFFREDQKKPHPFALVILNQPLNETALSVLRKRALTTVCADGGANRFFEYAKGRSQEDTDLPNTIIGDLDSITPEVRKHYEDLGVNVVQDDDQYSTDFTKSLRYLREREDQILSSISSSAKSESKPLADEDEEEEEEEKEGLSILILGGLGGRVDQAFSQIHHLYMINQSQDETSGNTGSKTRKGNLYLISEESITIILKPGKNRIHVPGTNLSHGQLPFQPNSLNEPLLEENVGIIPLSGPARISTKGFQWDVENWETAIGGQISTSNHIRAETVEVETGGAVLFTLELARRLKRGRSRS